MDIYSTYIQPVLIGIAAGLFSSWIAFKRYRKEKTWEMRRDIFRTILDCINQILGHAEYVRSTYCCEHTICQNDSDISSALCLLRKWSLIGEPFLTKKAFSELHHIDSFVDKRLFEFDENIKGLTEQEAASLEMDVWVKIRDEILRSLPIVISESKKAFK